MAAQLPDSPRWCVALSGGPDSLALTAVAAALRATNALIVDHGLQPGSDEVAAPAREQALEAARENDPVLLAHTLDDQAETVLMGLGRGSGPRSIAGMRECDPPWFRPLLDVRRDVTRAVCAELGLSPWDDPHNHDRSFTRVRLRLDVLPALEEALGGGVAEALARTAAALREDTDLLDCLAADHLRDARDGADLDIAAVRELPTALRRRVLRGWLLAGGAAGLTDLQIRAVDALITDWRGQGGVAVSSDVPLTRLFAERAGAALTLRAEPVR